MQSMHGLLTTLADLKQTSSVERGDKQLALDQFILSIMNHLKTKTIKTELSLQSAGRALRKLMPEIDVNTITRQTKRQAEVFHQALQPILEKLLVTSCFSRLWESMGICR